MKYYLVLFLSFALVCLYAQNDSKRDYAWVIGDLGGVSNTPNEPLWRNTSLYFGQGDLIIDTLNYRYMSFRSTCVSISDTSGSLLMYSNGGSINNFDNQLIENGNDIALGALIGIDDANRMNKGNLFLPFPNSDSLYILIHCAFLSPTFQPVSYYYTVIDITQNNGHGEVIDKNHEILNGGYLYGGLTACRHANGRDWWILVHKYDSDCFVRLLLSPSGLSIRGEQCMGLWETTEGLWDAIFTPDGSKYIYYSDTGEKMCIFDFDRCNGELSNSTIFYAEPTIYGLNAIAVSANSRFLYHSSAVKIDQYDLSGSDILNTKELVATYDSFMSPFQIPNMCRTYFYTMQLAPDERIYMSTGTTTNVLHIINFPDLKGDSCQVEQHALSIKMNSRAIPNFPNFRLGALSGSGCDTLTSVGEPIKDIGYASIYPNPARSDAAISWRMPWGVSSATLQITGSLGQTVYSEILPAPEGKMSLPLAHLPKGMYFYRIFHSEGQLYSGKLWKE